MNNNGKDKKDISINEEKHVSNKTHVFLLEDSVIKTKFPIDSAGRIMTKRVPVVFRSTTIEQVQGILSNKKNDFDTINYIYVVSKEGVLEGVLSIKEIFKQPKNQLVSHIMETRIVSAKSHTDQERLAFQALKNNIKAIPIIDKEGHLLGVVPSDIILDVLNSEHLEDVFHSAGIRSSKNFASDIIKLSVFNHFSKRFPWLFFGLIGGTVAAFIVGSFEDALRAQIILAAFIPVVVYMASAVGTQTQTIFIRSIAIDAGLNIKKYFIKEIKITFFIAIILGLILSVFSFYWKQSLVLGIILGTSLFFTIIVAMVISMFLPWFFFKRNIDPAIASGPFATALCDIISLVLYFNIAQIMLFLFDII